MEMGWNFEGRTAVVTGGLRGLGRAIADGLASHGARVIIFDWDLTGADDAPGQVVRVNVADSHHVESAVAALESPPTLLVNNAGVTRDRTLLKMSDEEWKTVLEVNLTGAFNMIRAVGPGMVAAGHGRIVNISSINGLRGKFGQANYAASKAGLIGLTKSAARELGSKGVTVNCVAPGMVMTDMARALPPEILQKARDETVTRTLVEPRDVAGAVLFFLSEHARFITGQVLKVDSGQYL